MFVCLFVISESWLFLNPVFHIHSIFWLLGYVFLLVYEIFFVILHRVDPCSDVGAEGLVGQMNLYV